MLLLVLALIVLIGMTGSFVRVMSAAITEHRIRRAGRPLTGEVISLDTRRRGYYGGYFVTPVVRYQLAGHQYEAPVGNRTDALGTGAGLDLLVDPNRPYEPIAVTGGNTSTALGVTVVGVLVGVGLTVAAVAQL